MAPELIIGGLFGATIYIAVGFHLVIKVDALPKLRATTIVQWKAVDSLGLGVVLVLWPVLLWVGGVYGLFLGLKSIITRRPQ